MVLIMKMSHMWRMLLVLITISLHQTVDGRAREDVIYTTSFLDNNYIRTVFRNLRSMLFRIVGDTGERTTGPFLLGEQMKFPCDITNRRSKQVPTSVHRLRPGDIDVIAALGDSLTAGSGASSVRFSDMLVENRGLSWSIGGQWSWHNATTLPNILKVFNPNLIGYSRRDTLTFHDDNQYNMAEIGASTADIPFMAKLLVQRMKRDKRVNFKKAWKMVTIMIGGNDICSFVCTMDDPDSLPKKHGEHMRKALRYFRDNMPRTFVNIVPTPFIKDAVIVEGKPTHCELLHYAECSCWIGHGLYNQSKDMRDRLHRIQMGMHQAEFDVANEKEFRGLDDFAAVFQPFPQGLNFGTGGIKYDVSLMAYDCFHMSQKGHSWAGVTLWNNILEPLGNKSITWGSAKTRFLCPTPEHPYIFTYENSRQTAKDDAIGNTIEN